MKRPGTFDRIQCQNGVILAVLSTHTACPHTQTTTGYAPAQSIAYPSYILYEKDDFNKRSAKHANKFTLVVGGANTQLGSSCVLAHLPTNVDFWKPIGVAELNTC